MSPCPILMTNSSGRTDYDSSNSHAARFPTEPVVSLSAESMVTSENWTYRSTKGRPNPARDRVTVGGGGGSKPGTWKRHSLRSGASAVSRGRAMAAASGQDGSRLVEWNGHSSSGAGRKTSIAPALARQFALALTCTAWLDWGQRGGWDDVSIYDSRVGDSDRDRGAGGGLVDGTSAACSATEAMRPTGKVVRSDRRRPATTGA